MGTQHITTARPWNHSASLQKPGYFPNAVTISAAARSPVSTAPFR